MLGRLLGGAAVFVLGVSLGLPGLGVARADVVFLPTTLDSHSYLNARLWGMGGAATALAHATDPLLANPAAAGFTAVEKVEIEISPVQQDGAEDAAGPAAFPDSSLLSITAVDYGETPCPSDFTSPGPGQLLGEDGLYFGLARRGGPGREWACGISTEVSPSADARLLELGVLSRNRDGLSLGFAWSDTSAGRRTIAQAGVVGLAYQSGPWAMAADLVKSAGDLGPGAQVFAGVECRLGNGLALRAGSAAGHPTYGIGCQKGRWAFDLARLSAGGEQVVLPGTTLGASGDVTVVSVSWMD